MSLHSHIAIAPATPADWPWIADSFRRYLLHHCDGEHSSAQAHRHTQRLTALMRGNLVRVAIARPAGHAEALGWAAALGDVLVFAYVREILRRHGIGSQLATSLTEAFPMRLAYWTPLAQLIRDASYPLVFDRDAYESIARIGRPRPPTITERIQCEPRSSV